MNLTVTCRECRNEMEVHDVVNTGLTDTAILVSRCTCKDECEDCDMHMEHSRNVEKDLQKLEEEYNALKEELKALINKYEENGC